MKNKTQNELKFLSDSPAFNDELGTHASLAKMLIQIVNSDSDNPLVVGIIGGWGTGKTSIVEIFRNLIKNSDIKSVYINAWEYSNSKERFARGFLLALASELIKCKLPQNEEIEKIDQRYERWKTKPSMGKSAWGILIVLTIVYIGFFMLIWWLYRDNPNAGSFFLLLVGTVIIQILLNFLLPKIMVAYEDRAVDDSFNQVEYFRTRFKAILQKSSFSKIVVIIDELDRTEPADALTIIRVLKTFISKDELGDKRFVFVVPFDERELACHISNELRVNDPHEFLRKIFNVTIRIPTMVSENIINFTKREFEKVRSGISPKINDIEADHVSFIISRAARKNPRQIKILINSFVGMWQCAGLVGTAGINRGISPLGVAMFVCLQYLVGDGNVDKIISELSNDNSELFNNNQYQQDEQLTRFLSSIEEFTRNVPDVEWLCLQRLQLSEDEKTIPNFIDICDAITDRDYKSLETLLRNTNDLPNLVARLEIKMREGDSTSQIRFAHWVLSLLASSKIRVDEIPLTMQRRITYKLKEKKPLETNLIDDGLAEFIVQRNLSYQVVIDLLTHLDVSDRKILQENDAYYRFVVRLVSFTKSDYWLNPSYHDALAKALDSLLNKYIPNRQDILNVVLAHLHTIVDQQTGINLADELANLPKIISLDNNAFMKVMGADEKMSIGQYAFAGWWMIRTPIVNQDVNLGVLALTMWSIESFCKLEDGGKDIQVRLPDENQFIELANGIARHCSICLRQGKVGDALLGTITLSLLSILLQKRNAVNPSVQAKKLIRNQVWPELIGKFNSVSRKDQTKLLDYLKAYPDIQDEIPLNCLATLCQYNDLKVLLRWTNIKKQNSLENILGELLGQSHWGTSISTWLRDSQEEDTSYETGLQSLFKIFEQKMPSIQKYEEVVTSITPLKGRKAIKKYANGFIGRVIDRIGQNGNKSIEDGIEIIRLFDESLGLDRVIREKLREKIKTLDIGLVKSILSDESRKWIIKKLG